MDLQDKIYIQSKNNRLPFQFSDDELTTTPVEITENTVTKLFFGRLPGYRLYLDGLDLISQINPDRIKVDSNDERYLNPEEDAYLLYNNWQNSFKYLPGRYLVRLVNESTGKVMYSELKVEPRYVSEDGLAIIKADLESLVKGLSKYFLSLRNGFSDSHSNESKYNELKSIKLLYQQHADFKAAIFNLMNRPRFAIKSVYHWTNQMNGPLDRKSLKQMAMNQRGNEQIYGQRRQLTYDTRDNRHLKRELNYLAAKVKQLKPVAQGLKNGQIAADNNRNFDHDAIVDVVNDYDVMLKSFLNQPWVQQITTQIGQDSALISNGYLDYRYVFFNQLDRQLHHPTKLSQSFGKQYLYYWKRTDLLYEIWGYAKVIAALTKLGFMPITGWIFDDAEADFQGLTRNTTVTFKSGLEQRRNYHLKVIYDSSIEAGSAEETESNDPLWHGNQHNRPDILIEIYDEDNIFIKAIILDTKYRNIDDVWRNNTNPQITAYKDAMFSPYPFKESKYAKLKKFSHNISENSAVISVGILYPGAFNANGMVIRKRSGIYAIPCNPKNNGLSLIKQFLKYSFDEFEKTMDDYEQFIDH